MDSQILNKDKYKNINYERIFQFPFLIEEYKKYAKFVNSNTMETGFKTLDNMLYGIKPGEVCYIISQTNIGKTAIAMNIIRNNISDNYIIPFFSLENNEFQLFERMLQLEYDLCSWDIEKNFADNFTTFIEKSEKDLMKYKNIINVVKRISLYDIPLYIEYLKETSELPVGMAVVDYTQLIKTPDKNEYTRVSEIATSLKELSLNFRIPVIALSQVSRGEARNENGLDIYSAKGSGEIENSAQILLTLEKPKSIDIEKVGYENFALHESGKLDILKLTIHKKKRGEFGFCYLALHKPSLRMEDITKIKQPVF